MVRKILMVCLGNICRSPLAEGILQSKLKNTGIQIDSAGTASYHLGENPDYRAISVAKKYGIDISGHIAKQFKISDFESYDIIYVMDENNYNDLMRLSGKSEDRAKVELITGALHPGMKIPVPDPYYGRAEDFEKTFKVLNENCELIAGNLTRDHKLNPQNFIFQKKHE
jgi:protein-tyrosine phosphatase